MKYVLALCSLVAVVWSGQAWAANRYVDGTLSVTCTGSTYSIASRNCTGGDGTGYKTIPEGLRALVKGDVLNIRAGTYVVVGVYGNVASDTYGCQSGGCPTSWATATVIQNYPGEAVVMQTQGFNMDNTRSTGGVGYLIWRGDTRANFIHEQRSGTDSEGFRFADGAHHVRISTMTLRNFTNTACLGSGGTINSSFIELLNNTISNCGDLTNQEHGIYPGRATSWLVDRNYFFANQGYGVHFNGNAETGSQLNNTITNNIVEGRKAGATASASCYVIIGGSGHTIKNNICIGLGGGSVRYSGGIELWGNSSNPMSGTTVYNNTVYDIVGWGIQVSTSNVSSSIIRNNILSVTPTPFIDNGTGTTKDHNHCTVVATGCVTPGAVGFVSVGTGDFSLTSTSTALNMGVAIAGIPYNTYTGKTVPDAGAFESFGFSTATINDVLMDVTLGMNLNVPILPATGITGFTVACSGGSNCGTPVVQTAVKRAGSDSIVRLTISGMGGSHVCEVGQTWTVTYTPGNVTDSTLIANTSTQKMFGFTTKPVTNACAGVPPVTSTITLEGTAVQSQAGTGTTVALQCGVTANRFVFVSVGIRDTTNQMSGITYNGVALTELGSKVVNAAGTVTGQAFYLANAASGSNTLSMTMSASDNWTVVASCWSGVDTSVPVGTRVTATSSNSAGSVTATATGVTDGIVLDALAKESAAVACTEDATQTEVVANGNMDAGTNIRTQSSYKTGVGSVVMTWTSCTGFGSEALIVVPVNPYVTPTPPAVGTFTQAAHRISSAYTKGGIEQPLSAISAANTSVRAGVPFAVTTQLDCTGNDCDPVGLRLRYSRNGAPFVRVPDVMDSNQIAFIGNVPDATVLRGAVSCCLSGALTPIAGTTQLTMDATPVVDLAQDASTVQRRVLVLGPDAVNGDTYDFEEYNQDLNPLDAYVPSGGARITVSTTQIAQVTGLHLVGPTAHSTLVGLVWSPSTDLFLQGYKVYRSTTSGVYGEAVHTITEATAGATMSPMTQWIHNEPVADTYYFVVTAFDWGGLESIVSSEVSVVKTGQGARRTR